jgi:uncharacterized protein
MTNQLRSSDYTIFVKVDDDNYLIIHGYTGSIDLISKNYAHALRINDLDKLPDSIKKRLQSRGYLTHKNSSEERNVVRIIGETIHKKELSRRYFMFLVAYDCNFRCPYCYESAISENGSGWKGEVLSKAMIDKAFSIISSESERTNIRNSITLYGGEPLLCKNKNIVEYIVNKGVDYGYTFSAITNGYELHHFNKILGKGKLNVLQITIDGNERIHNERRRHHLNGDTYKQILKNIALAIDNKVKVNVRVNVDKENIKQIDGFLEHIKSNKWENSEYFRCYAQPVQFQRISSEQIVTNCGGSSCADSEIKLNKAQLFDFIEKELDQDKINIINVPDNSIKTRLKEIFNHGGNLQMRSVFCSAHSGLMIFDPRGQIFSCWEFVGHQFSTIGNYYPNFSFNDENLKKWNSRTFYNINSCVKCKYALFCGGGCSAKALIENGKLENSYCNSFQAIFQRSVKSSYSEFLSKK